MAIFRKIHTSFWADTFVQDLDTDHKLFYLYLLTNERTKQCGIYEISKKQISFDTGYSIDRVSKLLNYFIKLDKIMYNDFTKELAIKNWNKFNGSSSPKVISCIKTELCNVKDTVLIEYVNGIYTPSQEEEEQEEEKEKEKEVNIPFDTFWNLYDKKIEKDKCESKWNKLTNKEREDIINHIPKYKLATPDKQYRKNPETYFNNKTWRDEIIIPHSQTQNQTNINLPQNKRLF